MLSKINHEALCQINYGMFIVSSFLEDRINGQIANVVFQVTSDPVKICTCLNKKNLTHEFVMGSMRFGVSILSQEADLKYIGRFGFCSGRDVDKFSCDKYKKTEEGVPLVLDYATSVLDVKVDSVLDVGTHTLFVGTLLSAEKIGECAPMTYDYYHRVIKGATHENAPTFQQKV